MQMYNLFKKSLVRDINNHKNVIGSIHTIIDINTPIYILFFYSLLYTLMGVTKFPDVDDLYSDTDDESISEYPNNKKNDDYNTDSICVITANALET